MEYVMFTLQNNMDCDMKGTYFIQITNNEKQIKKFKKINENNDGLTFFEDKYSFQDVIHLKKFAGTLFRDDGTADNVEYLILKGHVSIPGKNKVYDYEELIKWWETYLEYAKYPRWNQIVEEVIDLSKE